MKKSPSLSILGDRNRGNTINDADADDTVLPMSKRLRLESSDSLRSNLDARRPSIHTVNPEAAAAIALARRGASAETDSDSDYPLDSADSTIDNNGNTINQNKSSTPRPPMLTVPSQQQQLNNNNNSSSPTMSYSPAYSTSPSASPPLLPPAVLNTIETVNNSNINRSAIASLLTKQPSISPMITGARSTAPFGQAPIVATSELKQEPIEFNRVNIHYSHYVDSPEYRTIANLLRTALELRQKFLYRTVRDPTEYDIRHHPKFKHPDPSDIPNKSDHSFELIDGVYIAWTGGTDLSTANRVFNCPSRKEYSSALAVLMELAVDGPARSFCHNRLHLLEARFNLHELLNHDLEGLAQKAVPHRDFYNVRKIDNHVHHSACMNQKHLLRFIKYKLRQNLPEYVIIRNDKALTLSEVFESLKLTPYDLNVDTLDMHADKTFHRFDKFNLKYNPIGESRLREIFLKYSNLVKGKYLAELTQQVMDDLESNKYQFAEYRISIYGSSNNEWDNLSEWIVDNKLFHFNVRWMIQIPRLYAVYKSTGKIQNFSDMIINIFQPLFEVSVNPKSHPKLHLFLQHCVGFDIVDDESVREKSYNDSMPNPAEWNGPVDPPYALFAYYIYANLYSLNKLRESKHLTTFSFRPHAGEAGDIEHLACTFLLARGINHGLQLFKSPAIQYVYYLAQIGISMSPLSNNLLFLEYDKNPFPRFFARGLNVTLSTDDPLMIHVTKEPLVEEYSVAAQVWKLTSIDMSEIARNSVLQSDFEHRFKAHFLGNNYWLRGVAGNDLRQTNVPAMRVQFRADLLAEEMQVLSRYGDKPVTQELVDTLWQ